MNTSPSNTAKQAQAVSTNRAQAVPISVSLYRDATDAWPKTPSELTWPKFVQYLRDGVQHTAPALAPADDTADAMEDAWQASKRGLPGIVCAEFSGRRYNPNAGPHTALVLDVDRPTPDLLQRLAQYQAVAYESPSSRRKGPDDLRLKVVVVPTEPVPPHAVKAARSALARELGLDPAKCGVKQADAASQLAFIGRIEGTPERQVWVYDGKPWTAPPPGEGPPTEREQTEGNASEPLYGADHVPDLAALAPLLEPADPTQPPSLSNPYRSEIHFCRGLGGMMAKAWVHPEAIEQTVFALHDGRSHDPGKRAKLARETAEHWYQTGLDNVAGAGAVRAHVADLVEDPDAVIAHIREQCLGSWERAALAQWTTIIADRAASNGNAPSEPVEPVRTTDGLWQWVDADDLAKELPPVDYQCELLGFVHGDTRPDMIVGPPGYGKTGLAQAYALAVASGKPLFGSSPVKSGVVYHIDNEQGLHATQRRYQLLAGGMGATLRELRGKLRVFAEGVRLTRGDRVDERAVEALRRNTEKADIVIVDSLVTLGMGIDENSVAFAEVLMCLRAITQKGGPKFLVLHHSGKGESSANGRGTSAIDGERGSTWVGSKTFTWRHEKKSASHTGEPLASFTTAWEETAPTFREQLAGARPTANIICVDAKRAASGAPTADERRMVAAFVKEHPDGVSRAATELAMQGRIARDRVRGVIDTLLSDHVLAPHGGGKLSRLVPGPKITEVLA